MVINNRLYIFVAICLITIAAKSSFTQTHFTYNANTGNDMTLIILSSINPTLDGIVLENGDEISVFTPGGLCVGAGVWNGSNIAIAVHGDDDVTTIVDGIAAGEQLIFRVWHASLSTEGEATVTYASGGPNYSSDGMAILSSLTAVTSSSSSYTVNYNGNGNTSGSIPANAVTYLEGASIIVWDNLGSLAKTGTSFSGWNSSSDGSGVSYAAGSTFTMGAANVILYAQWALISTYTVIYNGNGSTSGTVPTDGNSYLQGTPVTVLGNTGGLTRSGTSFSGWNSLSDGSGVSYAAGSTFTMGTTNVILYAQWTLLPTYKVIYNGNGNDVGAVPIDGNNYLLGSPVTVLGNTGGPTRSGYTFSGWNSLSDGSGVSYAAGSIFTMAAANIILYAQWTLLPTYKVIYNGNDNTGGTVPIDSNNYLYDTTIVLGNTGGLTRTGYIFTGWNTSQNGHGTDYGEGMYLKVWSSNIILYAKWTLNNYAVIYSGNGSTGGMVPVNSNYDIPGSVLTISDNVGNLTKEGYTFAGWNTAADGSGKSYNAHELFTMGTTDVILYAQWKINSYVLTIKQCSDQNTVVTIMDTTVINRDTVRLIARDVPNGTFLKWQITAGNALLLDSTESACKIVVLNGNAEITAFYSTLSTGSKIERRVPTFYGMNFNRKNGSIQFSIPEINGLTTDVPVNIRIFDIQGHFLGCLIDKKMKPGYYSVRLGIAGKQARGILIGRMESLGKNSTITIQNY